MNHVDEKEIPYDGVHLQDMTTAHLTACIQNSSHWQQQLHTAKDELNSHNLSPTDAVDCPSKTMPNFHPNEPYRFHTTDHCLPFIVSDNESLQRKNATIGAFLMLSTDTNALNPLPASPASPVAITPYSEHGDCGTGYINNQASDDVTEALNPHSKDTDISYNQILPNLESLLRCRSSRNKSQVSERAIDFSSSGPNEAFKEDDFAISYTESFEKKDKYFNNWRKELNGAAERAKVKSRSVIKNSIPDRRYPASWSKYSTHDRKERTGSAGAEDRVEHTDFAIASVQDGAAVCHVNERSNNAYHYEGDDHESRRQVTKRSRFKEWEKKIKYKLHQMESVQTDMFLGRTRGRRGSLVPSLPLEYPELELLSGDMMTAAQIEAYVNGKLEDEEMERQKDGLTAIFSTEAAKRESSFAARQQSMQNEVADRPNEEQIVPGSIKHDYLTPTKGIAERTEGRKSRKKTEYEAMKAILLMIARESAVMADTRIASDTLPPLDARTNTKLIVEGCNPSIKDAMSNGGTSSKTKNALYNCQYHPGVEKCTHGDDMKVPKTKLESSGFYDDCIVTLAADKVDYKEGRKYEEVSPKRLEKGIFGTWSPGNWERYKDSTEANVVCRRPLSLGHLRKSTDDFHLELEKMETLEREKVLRVAQETWGNAP